MAEAISILAVLGSAKSGKSTTAQYLVDHHGYTRVRFAQTLKDMLRAMGLSGEQIDGPQAIRETPSDLLCGKTPRYAMQTLGTEWRDMIDKRLWARIARKRVSDLIASGVTKIVIDDMRFPHEAELFDEIGTTIIAIRRPEVEPSAWQRRLSFLPLPPFVRSILYLLFGWRAVHRSEIEWFNIEADHEIRNEGTLCDLYASIERIVS